MFIYEHNGTRVEEGTVLFAIDPPTKKTVENSAVFITHAHSDHAYMPNKPRCPYYMTDATADLLNVAPYRLVRRQEKATIGDFDVKMHDAGHILGSRMIQIANGESLLVTGDFKMTDDLLFKAAPVVDTDILIVEATFGEPDYKFPTREEVYEAMAKWAKANMKAGASIILAGYRIGKAQELTAFVNKYLDVAPIVHPEIGEVNGIYEKHGIVLGDYVGMDEPEAWDMARDASVFVMTPRMANMSNIQALSLQYNRRFLSAFATGWGNRFNSYSKSFPLSAHADFQQLISYVEQSGAKQVYTTHGSARQLARYIRNKLHVSAAPSASKKQSTLFDFAK